MFIFYDIIFILIVIIYLPIYLLKGKFHPGFLSRLGFLPKDLSLDKPIWIHAVSVGEAKAVKGLSEELRKVYPQKRFVFSTVTPTGNKIAQGMLRQGDFAIYLPLDLSFIVRKVINRINPSLFIIAETEVWPNLIRFLSKKKIPIVSVNGRISDASFKGYSGIKLLVKSIFVKVSLFCVQTNRDKERLILLGAGEDKIQVTGNMKFDLAFSSLTSEGLNSLRAQMDMHPKDKILIAGSTHPKEEEIILGAYKDLLLQFHELKLIIAPRHPERSNDIAKAVSGYGFRSVMVSQLPFKCDDCITGPVFILDSIGKLVNFYNVADIVFIGGSLVKKGGQNILEPASLEKPLIFGPYMFNFRDIADLFLDNKAAIMVSGPEGLKIAIAGLLNDSLWATQMGKRAKQLILQNQGATSKTIKLIRSLL